MKKFNTSFLFALFILIFLVVTAAGNPSVSAQTETETPTIEPTQGTITVEPSPTIETPSPSPTEETPPPTATLAPTETPFSRPLVVIDSYDTGADEVSPGDGFNLNLRLKNRGGSPAYNIVASFQSAEFAPLESGGVKAVAQIGSGDGVSITQPMQAAAGLWGYTSGSVAVVLNYTDAAGTPYTENFTVTIALKQPNYAAWAATATPTAKPRAQLVVGGYQIDADPLQPGTIFNLTVQVRNLGSTTAKNVTMVLGGGVVNTSDPDGGTQTGGMSGGGADLTNFAPLGSSNLIFIDEVPVGEVVESHAQLIVNVSANPGAYPFKLSFVYNDENGNRVVDDQVITLLVYSLPKVEVGFYRDPGVLMTGQPGPLPLQITNLGKTTAVLGNMQVSAAEAVITENVSLVGSLEPGGYFTMDSMVIPNMAGELTLSVKVAYTDDFNQPRTIEQTLTVMVEEMPMYEPGLEEMPGEFGEGGIMDPSMNAEPETFSQKALRFFKGLIGLGSAKPQTEQFFEPLPEEMYEENGPVIVGPKG